MALLRPNTRSTIKKTRLSYHRHGCGGNTSLRRWRRCWSSMFFEWLITGGLNRFCGLRHCIWSCVWWYKWICVIIISGDIIVVVSSNSWKIRSIIEIPFLLSLFYSCVHLKMNEKLKSLGKSTKQITKKWELYALF